ncbi:MAG TPA: HD domain-containing phosphohydrolase [Dissulfurispiraceae bacterium]|nr:HD domain-containing phosphohydrolase [Dissulfurispiraceae bacterium]
MSAEIQRVLYNISALSDLGREITSEKDFYDRIKSVLYVILGTFLTNKGAILITGEKRGELLQAAQKGFGKTGSQRIGNSSDFIRRLKKNRPCLLNATGASAEIRLLRSALSYSAAEIFTPLWVNDQFIGAIVLGAKFSKEPYGKTELELLHIIATQLAVSLNNYALFTRLTEQLDENTKLYEDMRRIYHETIQAFAAAIDAKDAYTKNHSHRVAKYSVAIARELGWNDHDVEGIYVAGYLHDVGKLILSNNVLNKKDALSDKDVKELHSHSLLSYTIISKIRFPWKGVLHMIKHHHERLDGAGYPEELPGERLSEGVKILSIADAFDAMTSDRPYRRKLPVENALNELKKCVDTQFDGNIVAAFCGVLEKEIKGELPEPNILPHLDQEFDPSMITGMLEALTQELKK